jgi:2'-5' RNA ligase
MRLFVAYSGVNYWQHAQHDVQQSQPSAPIRWTHPYNLHLTLYFIGDIEVAAYAFVVSTIKRVITATSSFILHPVGVVPAANPRSPSMIWLQYEKCEAFTELNKRLYDELKPIVKSASLLHDPIPHVTLARMKPRMVELEPIQTNIQFTPLNIDHAALWQTTYEPLGVRYKELEKFCFVAT